MSHYDPEELSSSDPSVVSFVYELKQNCTSFHVIGVYIGAKHYNLTSQLAVIANFTYREHSKQANTLLKKRTI